MSALPHGMAPCPRCGTARRGPNPDCGFCDGSGVVGDAGCWSAPHPTRDEDVNAELVRYAVHQATGWIAAACGWQDGTVDEWWETNASRFGEDHTLARIVAAGRLLGGRTAGVAS